MKLDRLALVAALERVKPALMSVGSIPSLKHVWLDGKFVYAYNGSLGVRVAYETELKPCGILGSVLLGLLKSTTAKEIELIQTKTQIDIKVGRASTSIPVLTADQNPWPFLPDAEVTSSIPLTEALIVALKRVQVIKKPKTPNNPGHHGVIVFPNKNDFVLYATDSKALAEVPVVGKISKDLTKVVLPYEFVSQLLTIDAGPKINFGDAITIEAEDIFVGSNLMDCTDVWNIPDMVDKTINGEEKRYPLPKELGEALDRALVLAGDMDKSFVTLSTSKKELSLVGRLESGELQEKFALASAAVEAKISVRLEHLKTLIEEASEFAIVKKALVLYGEDDSLFLITQHEGGKNA